MNQMTKRERLLAAIQKEEVDRVPFALWYHMPEVDQDAVHLAETQIAQAENFDLDFIKMMPFGNYSAQDYGLSVRFYCTRTEAAFEREFAVRDVKEWLELEPLPAYYGTYGKTLQIAQQLGKQLGAKGRDIPYVQTLFSPLTTAKKLAGPRVLEDLRSHPDHVHHALRAITETTVNFVKANIEAGVSGFFFASQCSTTDLTTEAEYEEFGIRYDEAVFNAFKDETLLNIVHIHGENSMFEKMANLPANCINWHDRWVEPDMATARGITDKCLLGGINEKWLETAKPDEIKHHIREAVEGAGRRGLIIAPGCCAEMTTPEVNFYAARCAVEGL